MSEGIKGMQRQAAELLEAAYNKGAKTQGAKTSGSAEQLREALLRLNSDEDVFLLFGERFCQYVNPITGVLSELTAQEIIDTIKEHDRKAMQETEELFEKNEGRKMTDTEKSLCKSLADWLREQDL